MNFPQQFSWSNFWKFLKKFHGLLFSDQLELFDSPFKHRPINTAIFLTSPCDQITLYDLAICSLLKQASKTLSNFAWSNLAWFLSQISYLKSLYYFPFIFIWFCLHFRSQKNLLKHSTFIGQSNPRTKSHQKVFYSYLQFIRNFSLVTMQSPSQKSPCLFDQQFCHKKLT